MKRKILAVLMLVVILAMVGCDFRAPDPSRAERQTAMAVQHNLIEAQPFPTDIYASFERFNIARRSYWINGMRERARTLPNPIPNPPLGYVILFAPNGGVVGSFPVDGKVTSLNYSLVPYSEYWEIATGATVTHHNRWIANPGGVYGTNTNGIFWFTPDGRYMEWNGVYLFSDIPFLFDAPVLRIEHVGAAETPPVDIIEEPVGNEEDIDEYDNGGTDAHE